MVCPSCHIMTGRRRRGRWLEQVCRYPACRCYGQVVARAEIPAPAEEEAVPVTEDAGAVEAVETTDE